MKYLLITVFLVGSTIWAEDFSFLDLYEIQPPLPAAELAPEGFVPEAPLRANLTAYHKKFRADGIVSIYIGHGKEAAFAGREKQVSNMLRALLRPYGLRFSGWNLTSYGELSVYDKVTRIRYLINFGNERNAYQSAFADHEIVMYHGHSRNGRGPAFETFSNYFRMGLNFPTIEVEAANPYFRNEELKLTEQYPAEEVIINGVALPYQYVGEKDPTSKLNKNEYVKNIAGQNIDLLNTDFINGPQILYFYSCTNEWYWKAPLRSMFPDVEDRFIFGTKEVSYWSSKPTAVFLSHMILGTAESLQIVSDLNATKDCKDCFTTF